MSIARSSRHLLRHQSKHIMGNTTIKVIFDIADFCGKIERMECDNLTTYDITCLSQI